MLHADNAETDSARDLETIAEATPVAIVWATAGTSNELSVIAQTNDLRLAAMILDQLCTTQERDVQYFPLGGDLDCYILLDVTGKPLIAALAPNFTKPRGFLLYAVHLDNSRYVLGARLKGQSVSRLVSSNANAWEEMVLSLWRAFPHQQSKN